MPELAVNIFKMRILYLTFHAPPLENIPAYRSKAYQDYLPGHGIKVDVLTRQYDNKNLASSDFEVMKSDTGKSAAQILPGIHATGFYNFPKHSKWYNNTKSVVRVLANYYLTDPFFYGWRRFALNYYDEHLANNKYDLLVATYNPLITFIVAQTLSKKYRIPWVAEYRDSFITDTDKGRTLLFKKLVQKRALRGVSGIITVSHAMAGQLQKSFSVKQTNIPVTVNRNGFDDAVLPEVSPVDTETWQFFNSIKSSYDSLWLHTGTIYDGQNIRFFLEALSVFNSRGNAKAAFVFVGQNRDGMNINQLAGEHIYILPKVRQATNLCMLQSADVLLLPAWYRESTRSFPAKVFEYIYYGKQVLCSPEPPPDFEEFLLQYPNVTILKTQEQLLSSFAVTDITTREPSPALKKQLTRRYWMGQLAALISQLKKEA
jgi:Glycosyltransferase Family 4/Glycosyl transferases group 1